jgi:hypothetical protein
MKLQSQLKRIFQFVAQLNWDVDHRSAINFWSSVDQNLDKLIVTSGKIHLLMMVIKSSVKLQAILY